MKNIFMTKSSQKECAGHLGQLQYKSYMLPTGLKTVKFGNFPFQSYSRGLELGNELYVVFGP